MQTFLDYLFRRHDAGSLAPGFGLSAFFQAGPVVLILEAILLMLCGLLIAGCFHYRGTGLHRSYLTLACGPLAWGIGVFTWRMLGIIDTLGRSGGQWVTPFGEMLPLSDELSQITAVLLTCGVLTGIFLALSPILRPRTAPPKGSPADAQMAA